MKYQRWYDQIIERARGRKPDFYVERHHIIPRSFGGTDDPGNLVDLTYREHFLVHWLLVKICTGHDRILMAYALNCMTMSIGGRIVAGWQFDVVKGLFRQEYLIRLSRRYKLRKERLRAKRIQAEQDAARVPEAAAQLTLSRSASRNHASALAADWLKGHPAQVRRRNRKTQNIDIRAKAVIAEANKLLGSADVDDDEPTEPKRKRIREGRRERLLRRTAEQ